MLLEKKKKKLLLKPGPPFASPGLIPGTKPRSDGGGRGEGRRRLRHRMSGGVGQEGFERASTGSRYKGTGYLRGRGKSIIIGDFLRCHFGRLYQAEVQG